MQTTEQPPETRQAEPPIVAVLRELKERGVTQAEISKQVGMPQSRVSRWSQGKACKAANDALNLRELLDKQRRRKANKPSAA